ncbi:MAG: aldo/keto reductase [Gammaproteobacteria bacterium]
MNGKASPYTTHGVSRRDILKLSAATGVAGLFPRWAIAMEGSKTMLKRRIPSSGEELPAIGLGTSQVFDVGTSAGERAPLREVLRILVDSGASVVDSSPMYGRSEGVVGDLTADLDLQEKIFYATKVWTRGKEAGIRQMEQSMDRFKLDRIDLMQVHNLLDTQTHLATLREWRDAGRIRYLGVTHYEKGAYDDLMRVIRKEKLDFVQFNYSPLEAESEDELLPLAADRGVAVIVNEPFDSGRAFSLTRGKELPPWAAEFDCESWAQFFLKYILGHPAVTCAIPGTSDPEHARDNLQAGVGRLPDEKTRQRMREYLRDL